MAVTFEARDKDHRRWANLCHEQCVVICAADHFLYGQFQFAANLDDRLHERRIANGRRVHIHALHLEFNPTPLANSRDRVLDFLKRAVAGVNQRVAQSISSQARHGTLFTAPGSIRKTPVVATVSELPLEVAAFSTARAISAPASNASRRPGIKVAPACPPPPVS